MRESTSLNQANGSTPHRLQEAMKLRNTAAVLPPAHQEERFHETLTFPGLRLTNI